MAMRRDTGMQGDLVVGWAELPRSPGHAFCAELQKVLLDARFDVFVENGCKPNYAAKMGAPSLPPGRYFRMHMVRCFEGLDGERGIVWRCADSSLRDFLRLSKREKVPDHSWLSKTRSRLPHEVHEKVFGFVSKPVAECGLVKGERIGVDGSTMEANAALRSIVRRDNGEAYRAMLERMAKEIGIATPNAENLARFDRKRRGKKLSNDDWTSATDAEAKIARMKDGTTHLADKPERAVDLDTGGIVAAPIHEADNKGDTTTLGDTLETAKANLTAVGLAPTPDDPCEIIADKGYDLREVLKNLDDGEWKSRISEPLPAKGGLRWQGDEEARDAVYANRARLKSGVGRAAMRKRDERLERSFAHVLDRGGMRWAWLRGRENVAKRYLIHVAGFNLGVLIRALTGCGTFREAASVKNALLFFIQTEISWRSSSSPTSTERLSWLLSRGRQINQMPTSSSCG